MLTSTILPLLSARETIRDAVRRLTDKGTSAVVIRDGRGSVVVTDRSLLNTLVSEGNQPLSRVADRAFPGLLGARTVLADAQRKYLVTESADATTALVNADPDAAKELSRPSMVKFPDQRTITTVELPLLNASETVGDAVQRLTNSRRRAIVINDKRGPVVATDRSLLDAFEADPQQRLSRIADQVFKGRFVGEHTELGLAQRQYTVRAPLQGGTAQVDVDAAQELDQPSLVLR